MEEARKEGGREGGGFYFSVVREGKQVQCVYEDGMGEGRKVKIMRRRRRI
jgi:hypothetical protein